jgi:hypothetical protein
MSVKITEETTDLFSVDAHHSLPLLNGGRS